MMRMNKSKKELIDRLNECGRNWTPIKCTYEEALLLKDQTWRSKWIEICTLTVQIFDLLEISEQGTLTAVDELSSEAVWKILMKDVLKNFDPEKYDHRRYNSVSLYRFIKDRINFRKMDILTKESRKVSLSTPIDEDEDLTVEDKCSSDEDEYRKSEICEYAADIFRRMAMILRTNSKRGKAIKYYQVMYTSDIISNEKQYAIGMYKFQHEREIDDELYEKFVDYCMEDKCQGVRDIYYGQLKQYGKVVKKVGRHKAEEQIPLPIEDKVAIEFLGITKSYYSTRHDEYLALIEEIKER